MYFDRILFGAAFVTMLGTAALALATADAPNGATAATAQTQAVPSLDRVVVIGRKEDART